MKDICFIKKKLHNNKTGATLVEVMLAAVILLFLSLVIYRVFFRTERFERDIETRINAYNVASGIIDNFARYQGTGKRRDGAVLNYNSASFETLDAGSYAFEPAVTHDITTVQSVNNYEVAANDHANLRGNFTTANPVVSTIKYEITDNTNRGMSGVMARDGFRIVKVNVEWHDEGIDILDG